MNARVWLAAVVAVLACATIAAGTEIADPDAWWNAADGVWRLAHSAAGGSGEPPTSFFGAHGCEDPRPHVTMPQLFGLAWIAGGEWGLVVVRAGLFGLVGLAALYALRRARPWHAALVAACVVGALAFRSSPRGELVGIALLAWITALLVDVVDGAKGVAGGASTVRLAGLCALAVVLAWSHGLYVMAPVTGAMALGAALVERAWFARTDDERAGARRRMVRAAWATAALTLGALLRPHPLAGLADARAEREVAHALGFREYAPFFDAVAQGYRHPSLACLGVLVVVALVAAAGPRAAGARAAARVRVLPLTALAAVVALALDSFRGAPVLVAFAPLLLVGFGDLAPRVSRILALAAGCAFALVAADRAVDDPALHGNRPPDLAPARLTPIAAARWFASRRAPADRLVPALPALVFAPLHGGNWLLLHSRAVDDREPDIVPVWTGRRTYSLACGLELLAARSGGAAFDAVDARLHPAFVLADTLHEQKLVDTLIAKGWQLAYLDLSWSVFARPRSGDASTVSAPATAMTVDADPARMLDAENRPVDAAFAAGALGVACSVVRRSAGDDAARGVCAAAAQATRR